MSDTSDTREPFCPEMIMSGGQTGADRGALIAAAKLGVKHGGWVPKGRLAEDGKVPACYPMTECSQPGYPVRTELNIDCSDATLIFTYEEEPTGGSALTIKLARKLKRAVYHMVLVRLARIDQDIAAAQEIRRWLARVRPATLNVAGARESKAPRIQDHVCAVVMRVLQQPSGCVCGRQIPQRVWESNAPAVLTGVPVRCSECGWVTHWAQFDVTPEPTARSIVSDAG